MWTFAGVDLWHCKNIRHASHFQDFLSVFRPRTLCKPVWLKSFPFVLDVWCLSHPFTNSFSHSLLHPDHHPPRQYIPLYWAPVRRRRTVNAVSQISDACNETTSSWPPFAAADSSQGWPRACGEVSLQTLTTPWWTTTTTHTNTALMAAIMVEGWKSDWCVGGIISESRDLLQ